LKTNIKVCDAMTRKPIAVSMADSVKKCVELMKKNSVGSLVVKDNDKLHGMITYKSLVHNVILNELDVNKTKAKDILKTDYVTISPDIDIFDAIVKMKDLDKRQMPVVTKEGKLVGLLTLKDILKIEPQLFEMMVEKIQLREEDDKPVIRAKTAEGTCDYCGEYFEKLNEYEGQLICKGCRDEEVRARKK
jgi:CBS domain-containing protein